MFSNRVIILIFLHFTFIFTYLEINGFIIISTCLFDISLRFL